MGAGDKIGNFQGLILSLKIGTIGQELGFEFKRHIRLERCPTDRCCNPVVLKVWLSCSFSITRELVGNANPSVSSQTASAILGLRFSNLSFNKSSR